MRYNSSGFYEENLSLLGLCSESLVENGGPDPEKYSDVFSAAFENGITFFFVDPKSGETVEKVFGENLNKNPAGNIFFPAEFHFLLFRKIPTSKRFFRTSFCILKTDILIITKSAASETKIFRFS